MFKNFHPSLIKYKYQHQGALIINIVIGLAIIGLLTAVSIPNFRVFQATAKFDNAARALVSDLRYAQQMAITEQITYGIIINEAADFYEIVSVETATTTIKTVALPADIIFNSVSGFSGNFIAFNSYGSVQESGSIILANPQGDHKTIQVKPSGYVQF